MSKSTELPELQYAWHEQKVAIHRRTHSASGYLKGHRWEEVFNSHRRKFLRQKRLRNRAAKIACYLVEIQMWYEFTRNCRKRDGLPPLVTRLGNSGKAIQ